MSKTIDERVVEMRFDNSQFEQNVQTSISTIEKLKQKLNFKGASQGLEEVGNAAKKVDMSGLSSAVETVHSRFSALEVVGVTALVNITNAALRAGGSLLKSFTIDPIITGFHEYETQINSVQTILANTASKGTDIKQVNAALDELNQYADQTIYNFAQMTENIGRFTAAGVDLETSVDSIKGIANLAAISGSSATQASSAMYQLSQAIASGTVKLQDWNSVVNAGMGGEVFQNALKRTAEHFGYNVDAMIEKYGSFRESLTEGGWLTTEVLTETLAQLSGAYTEADLIAQGYTESQAKEIVKLAETAKGAATDIKTFTQLMDTTKEAIQSGWAETWEIIIGDYEEAKTLLTGISDYVGTLINNISDARNQVLQGWSDLGGRTALFEGLQNVFEGILSVLKSIGDAFNEVFSPITAERLYSMTESFRKFSENLKISDETAESLKNTFKGLFSVIDIVLSAIGTAASAILPPLISVVGSFAKVIVTVAGGIGSFITKINEGIEAGNVFASVGDAVSSVLDGIANAVSFTSDGFSGLGDIISSVAEAIATVFSGALSKVGDAFNWIRENISAADIFAGLAGGGVFVLAKKLSGFIDKIIDIFKDFGKATPTIKDTFSDVLSSIHSSLESFQQGISVASLLGIAAAVTLLSSSLSKISEINPGKIAVALGAIEIMILELNSGFSLLSKTLVKFSAKGTFSGSLALLALAEAVNILASAMAKLSGLSWGDIIRGLTSVGGLLVELAAATKLISGSGVTLKTSVALLALAKACEMLGESLKEFSSMSWGEIGRGLTSMGIALAEVVASVSILDRFGGAKSLVGSISILILIQSLKTIGESLKQLGSLSWGEIGRGLTSMGIALAELTTVLGILSKVSGLSSIISSVSILIIVQALDPIANALMKLGSISWGEVARGLVSMGGALAELAAVSGLLGKLSGFSGILGAGAIVLAVQSLNELAMAFQQFGSMSWGEIARGLTGMGGALAELAIISGTLGKLGGLSGLLGAGTLLVAIQGLGDLANAMMIFGSMSWGEIARGLVAMGGALTELAAVSGILGTLTHVFGLLGSTSLLIGIQGLNDLALALEKFGSMSWDEIGRGLAAMGAAMGETALGGLLNTFSGLGSASINLVAESLGILADSVKKWADVTVPENLGTQLGTLAAGIMKFTLGGFGADAISTLAAPLGTMADSIRKWSGVTIPENLGTQIGSLASGIKEFTFGGFGASALAEAAPAIGTMADSIRKWSGVTIPENLESGLSGIASGIEAFTFAFVGGWSIGSIVDPLSQLADSVQKWSGVNIATNIGDSLKSLADGVKAFNWAFIGSWSIDEVAGPIGTLADSAKKWSGLDISTVGTQLTSLSNGLKSIKEVEFKSDSAEAINDFLNSFGGESVALVASNISAIVTAFNNMSNINVASVDTFSTALEKLGNVGVDGLVSSLQNGVTQVSTAINSIVTSIQTSLFSATFIVQAMSINVGTSIGNGIVNGLSTGLSGISSTVSIMTSGIATALLTQTGSFTNAGTAMGTALTQGFRSGSSGFTAAIASAISSGSSLILSKAGTFRTIGTSLMTAFNSGIQAGSISIRTTLTSVITNAVSVIQTSQSKFTSAGQHLMDGLISGIKGKIPNIDSMFRSIITTTTNTIRSGYSSYRSAGSYIVQGLIDGINAKKPAAIAAAKSMAQAVEQAAKARLEIQSPSQVFFKIGDFIVQGLSKGIKDNTTKATNASKATANKIVEAFQKTLKIESPSKVTKDEVGRYIVEGIAEGITEDMTAEQAAAQKAQNIVNAFKTELDKLDMSMTTVDLEMQLWEAMYGDTSGSTVGRTEFLVKKMNMQIEKIKYAQAEYKTTLAEFGENAEETEEAYQKYLQAQLDLVSIADSIDDENINIDIGQILSGLAKLDPEIVRKDASDASQVANEALPKVGESMVNAVDSGVKQNAPKVADSAENMAENSANAAQSTTPMWRAVGGELINSLVDGMSAQVANAAEQAAAMARTIYNAAMSAIPSSGGTSEEGSSFVPGSIFSDASIWEGDSSSSLIKDSISKTAQKIGETLNKALSGSPTIKPVVDLSDVKSSVSKINTMFSSTQATSISSGLNSGKTIGKSSSASSGATTYNFTQNNYSPKALSRIDIYRQTKNQFSTLKKGANS